MPQRQNLLKLAIESAFCLINRAITGTSEVQVMRFQPIILFLLVGFFCAGTPVSAQTELLGGRVSYFGDGRTQLDGDAVGALLRASIGDGLEADNYRAIEVLIESPPQSILNIGLTKERIQTRVEVRLRSLGISPDLEFVPSDNGYKRLYVNIGGAGDAFHISVELKRYMPYFVRSPDGEGYLAGQVDATTWATSGTGTHAGDATYVLGLLDGLLDRFLNEYLEANTP